MEGTNANVRCHSRTGAALFISWLLAGCGGPQSALDPAGPDAARIAELSWVVFALGAGVYLLVLGVLAVPIVRSLHSRRQPDLTVASGEPQRWGIWSGGIVLPAFVLLALLFLSVPVALATSPDRDRDHGLAIEIIGHQFWWEVHYPDAGVVTANEIHIPVGESVRLHLTSADVIHSFWVPRLHGKIDLTPGHETQITLEADQVGTYRGQCAEYCGLAHAQMAIQVIAEEPGDFNDWLSQQARPAAEPSGEHPRDGQAIFLGGACAECHTVRGHGATGQIGPDLTHLASRETIGAGVLPNTTGHLGGWIMNPQELKPGNRMPAANLDGEQLQALLDYLEGLE